MRPLSVSWIWGEGGGKKGTCARVGRRRGPTHRNFKELRVHLLDARPSDGNVGSSLGDAAVTVHLVFGQNTLAPKQQECLRKTPFRQKLKFQLEVPSLR